MDLLAAGQAWLTEQRHRFMSRPVTYQRDGESILVQATPGRSPSAQVDEFSRVLTTIARDYLIRAQDLVLAGRATTPRPGDRIREVLGGQAYTFEVAGRDGEPAWVWSDPQRTTFRIHVQEVAVE